MIVSCTGNPQNTGTGALAKTYQWFHSAGNAVTESTPFPPNNFVRDNILKQDSGVYECRYTLTSSGETTRSYVTINVAGMFVCIMLTHACICPAAVSTIIITAVQFMCILMCMCVFHNKSIIVIALLYY